MPSDERLWQCGPCGSPSADLLGDLREPDGHVYPRCTYTPQSHRATTATLLLSAGVDIAKVQELLGHRHLTTTQTYSMRRRKTAEGAPHDVPN